MFWPYVVLWIPMVVIAIANGVLREASYGRKMTAAAAHRISTAVAIVLFTIYIGLVLGLRPMVSIEHAMAVGLLWFLLTVAFEFLFGHYVAKHPWSELVADWNIVRGRLWPLVPLWIAVAPSIFHHLRT